MAPRNFLRTFFVAVLIGCDLFLKNASASPGDAGAPIPQKPGAFTQRDADKANLEWARKHVLASYYEFSKGKKWQAVATKFMDEVVPVWAATGSVDYLDTTEIASHARDALAQGCHDPLVRFFAAWINVYNGVDG